MSSVRMRLWLVLGMVAVLGLVAPAAALAVPTYLTSFNAGGLVGPSTVAADGYGNVYVADEYGSKIVKYNSAGAVAASWNSNGTGVMDEPIGICVTPAQQVFVAEINGNRVDEYTSTGVHVRQIGLGAGTGNGQFDSPAAVRVDRFGFIYVIDLDNFRMQKFRPDGTYMAQWPMSAGWRYGFAIDTHGNFFVANYLANTVERYSSTGAFVTQWSCPGGPLTVEIGPDGNLYCGCYGASTVRVFKKDGTPVYTFGTNGASDGQFRELWGPSIDGQAIYVGDRLNNRVQKWTLGATKPVARIGGYDRYAVAVNLAATRWPGYTGMKHVIVVCGEDRANADPLAAAGLAGVWDAPILLTTTGYLFPTTKTALQQMRTASGPLQVHVIGGTASIPAKVFNAIKACNPGGTTERIDGHDRYQLSAAIASRARNEADALGIVIPGVLVFNAENSKAFYDALAASTMSAHSVMPMIAVQTKKVPASASWVLANKFAGKPRVVVNSAAYIPASTYSAVGAWARMSNVTDPKASAVQISTFGRIWGLTPLTNMGLAAKLPDSLTGGTFLGLEGGVITYTDKAPLSAATSNFVAVAKPGTLAGWVFGSNKSVADSTFTQFANAVNTP
jgi:hypothetical protein